MGDESKKTKIKGSSKGKSKDQSKAKNKEKFKELTVAFETVIAEVDKIFDGRKKEMIDGKIKTMEQGFKSRKEFLMKVEADAIATASKMLGSTLAITRDRWRVMTLPMPIFIALEEGEITFPKAKLATALSFDPENTASIDAAARIVQKMIDTDDIEEIKKAVAEEARTIWNPSTAVMDLLFNQAKASAPK